MRVLLSLIYRVPDSPLILIIISMNRVSVVSNIINADTASLLGNPYNTHSDFIVIEMSLDF